MEASISGSKSLLTFNRNSEKKKKNSHFELKTIPRPSDWLTRLQPVLTRNAKNSGKEHFLKTLIRKLLFWTLPSNKRSVKSGSFIPSMGTSGLANRGFLAMSLKNNPRRGWRHMIFCVSSLSTKTQKKSYLLWDNF